MYALVLLTQWFLLCGCTKIEYHDASSSNNKYLDISSKVVSGQNVPGTTVGISRVWYRDREEIRWVKDLPMLRYVKIESAGQEFVPKFRNVPKLESVFLEKNEITYVSDEHFGSTTLVYAFLRFNIIRAISEGTFGERVKHVYLSCNNLTRFDSEWFQNPARLEVLDLDANNIRHIEEGALEKFIKLDYIYLMHNGLLTIGDRAFSHRNFISEMWLAFNHLTAFPETIFKDTNVTIELLDISFNKLTYLPRKLMENLKVLSTPHIDGNPWQCPCYYPEIITWINWETYGKLIDRDRPREPRCVVSKGRFRNTCVDQIDIEAIRFFLTNSSPPPEDRASYCHQKMVRVNR